MGGHSLSSIPQTASPSIFVSHGFAFGCVGLAHGYTTAVAHGPSCLTSSTVTAGSSAHGVPSHGVLVLGGGCSQPLPCSELLPLLLLHSSPSLLFLFLWLNIHFFLYLPHHRLCNETFNKGSRLGEMERGFFSNHFNKYFRFLQKNCTGSRVSMPCSSASPIATL